MSEITGGGILTSYKTAVIAVGLVLVVVVGVVAWRSMRSAFVSSVVVPLGASQTGSDWFVVLCDGCVASAKQILELPRPFMNYVKLDAQRRVVWNQNQYDLSRYDITTLPMWINRRTGEKIAGHLSRARLEELGVLV